MHSIRTSVNHAYARLYISSKNPLTASNRRACCVIFSPSISSGRLCTARYYNKYTFHRAVHLMVQNRYLWFCIVYDILHYNARRLETVYSFFRRVVLFLFFFYFTTSSIGLLPVSRTRSHGCRYIGRCQRSVCVIFYERRERTSVVIRQTRK